MHDFRDPSLPVEDRVTALLAELRLDEKISLCAGRNFWQTRPVPRLRIPSLKLVDGPRGVAFHSARRRCTAFPSGIALGASWDPELARRVGAAIGEETRASGARVVLGPAVNLCRTPLNGRTFEYLTEDPFLNAALAVAYVQGVQSRGVAACVKHFAANNQETHRMRTSARVDERTLRELYLPVFEATVREGGAWAVMAAYNAVNGVAACEHERLLWELLREEWGFLGMVVSDWFAVRRTASPESCLRAGLSLEMPGPGSRYRRRSLRRAHAEGRIRESQLDRALRGLLRLMVWTGHLDASGTPSRRPFDAPAHQRLAREAAEAGLTLLKNEADTLPLDVGRLRRVALLGPKARARHCLPLWGGSSAVWPPHEVTPEQGLREALGEGVELVGDAAGADVAIVVVGLGHRPGHDSEVRDRRSLELPPAQRRLIRDTARANPNTVVVLVAGSPLEMDWADEVPAILMAWYPGMEGGRAIADALLGVVNPSGRLPVSFPERLEDSPAHRSPATFPGDGHEVRYAEGVFVGYRHFDRAGVAPRFPFGHGLSYTRFEYTGLQVERELWEGDGELAVAVELRNVGPRPGAEVVQLYLGDPECSVPRPPRELKGFRKLRLEPGESARVEFRLGVRDLAFFSEAARAWVAEAGAFTLEAGGSSRALPLRAEFRLAKDVPIPFAGPGQEI